MKSIIEIIQTLIGADRVSLLLVFGVFGAVALVLFLLLLWKLAD
jgi:hypothetical protein